MSHTVAKQSNGQFQITFTIPQDQIKTNYQKALKELAKDVKIDGFRKGNAPLDKVEQSIDKSRVFEKVIQQILPEIYAEAVEKEKLQPIISPQVRLISAPMDGDWQLEATSCESPKVDLKDTLKSLKGLFKSDQIWTPGKDGEPDKPSEPTEEQKIAKIIDHLVKSIDFELPTIILEQETDHQLSQLVDHIQKLGLSLDQYLASTGKTHDTLREEFTQRAAQEIKADFIIGEISRAEKIVVNPEEIQELIDHTQDPQLKKAVQENPQARIHLHASLLKRKTFEHLIKLAS